MATACYPRQHIYVQRTSKSVERPRCGNPLCRRVFDSFKPGSYESGILYRVPVVHAVTDREATVEYYCPDMDHVDKVLAKYRDQMDPESNRYRQLLDWAVEVAGEGCCRTQTRNLTKMLQETVRLMNRRVKWAEDHGLYDPDETSFPRHLRLDHKVPNQVLNYLETCHSSTPSLDGLWRWCAHYYG